MSDERKNRATPGNGNSGAHVVSALDARFEGLRAERRAALNLLEDAVSAREAAERLSTELRYNETRLQKALSIQTVGVLFFSLNGRINDANGAFLRMSGYTREELVDGFDWNRLTPPDFREATAQAARDLAEYGETVPYEKQMVRKDGSRWWGLFAPTRISGEGADSECVEFIVDVTDRREAETALRASEERYRTLFNSIDEGFCVVEMIFNDAGEPYDWQFSEVNPAFEKNNGLHDAVGRTMLEMVPNIEPKWFDIYGNVAESLKPKRFEMRSAALDRWFNLYAFPVGEPAEHKLAVLFTDVTMQKQTEEELRESSERMRLLIESATHVSIFTTDENGVVNSWNSGSARIYGYAEEEILGREVAVLFSEEDRERGVHFREMETAVKEGRALDERWHRRKDGTTFYASGLTQPIGDGSEGFVKIARDMTEQLRAEEARHEKELMQTLVDAQESERRRIARDLHDELGQQLTALRLKLNRVSEEAPEPLEGQISEVKEIAKCIDEGVDFLAWELRPAALDDLGLVPAVEKYVREWSSYTGVPGRVNSTALAGKRFDPSVETALYRIVQECLNNVHKHAQARNAQVTLRIRRGKIMLTVDDDGAGFDVCDHEVQTRGIGLIGMQERVQMIGGTMEIESENGLGTTVFVKAPIASV